MVVWPKVIQNQAISHQTKTHLIIKFYLLHHMIYNLSFLLRFLFLKVFFPQNTHLYNLHCLMLEQWC